MSQNLNQCFTTNVDFTGNVVCAILFADPPTDQYGSGVHKEYTFVDDPEVVAETLQTDVRLEDAEHEEDLVKSVVNAQIDDFFEGN